jgi:16S rRNA (cytosine967-C5)-methyltransferase
MRFQSYFNTALSLIKMYNGSLPLAHFLKQYFAQNKKHGSRDRKLITHLCYCYYRLGHALKNLSIEERLLIAFYLCNEEAGEWQILFDETWNEWSSNLNERMVFIQRKYPTSLGNDIFPWKDELSETIHADAFARSYLIQPDLFLRLRPDQERIVKEKLSAHQILFHQLSSTCLALSNSSKIDSIIETDKEAVVQDYSSQRISEFLSSVICPPSSKLWDCCAASGGKSVLAKDVLPNIELTVSDVRPSILQNLKQRFAKAGIGNYKSFVQDLTIENGQLAIDNFDLIICDAPCTGSGTWSRTPEQLYFFTEEKINEYATLQKKIVRNVILHLKEGGCFLYITCSVFKKENEKVVDFIQQQFPSLQLIKKELLIGYDTKADTMFGALFKKV